MPTSWNVTPHRDEHGYPATMTGDDCMKVLDFDTEPAWMRIHATEIMVINGKGWLEGRLQHYREKSNALFRPTGKELAEAPDRTAQLIAEILLRQVGKGLKDMEIESEPYESLMADYDEESSLVAVSTNTISEQESVIPPPSPAHALWCVSHCYARVHHISTASVFILLARPKAALNEIRIML